MKEERIPPWSLPAALQGGCVISTYRRASEAWLRLKFSNPPQGGVLGPGRLTLREAGVEAPASGEKSRPPALCRPVFSLPALTLAVIHSSCDIFVFLPWGKNAAGISRRCFISMVPPNNPREQTEAEDCPSVASAKPPP